MGQARGTHQLESAESDREEGRASEGTHQQAGKSGEGGKWGEQGALASWKAGQVREGLERARHRQSKSDRQGEMKIRVTDQRISKSEGEGIRASKGTHQLESAEREMEWARGRGN